MSTQTLVRWFDTRNLRAGLAAACRALYDQPSLRYQPLGLMVAEALICWADARDRAYLLYLEENASDSFARRVVYQSRDLRLHRILE